MSMYAHPRTSAELLSDEDTFRAVVPYTKFFYRDNLFFFFVHYESTKRELKRRLEYERRYDEKLKSKTEESIRVAYNGLVVDLEHLKIKTRLIDEKFASLMGECVI
jgi:hypothetical protein